MSINEESAESLAVWSDDEHSSIRDNLTWGTYGKDGSQPLHYVALKDMDTGHVEAVMEILSKSSSTIDAARFKLMQAELDHRELIK